MIGPESDPGETKELAASTAVEDGSGNAESAEAGASSGQTGASGASSDRDGASTAGSPAVSASQSDKIAEAEAEAEEISPGAEERDKTSSQSGDFIDAASLTNAKEQADAASPDKSEDSGANKQQASSLTLTQHHVSHLLSDVLEEGHARSQVMKSVRFPMIFDLLLGLGLLVAVGGFTVGLIQMYLIHSASQNISEQRYTAAIAILKGAPMPQVFARPGSDTEDLLSKARYLDAMDKLEAGSELETAIKELGEIRPGSRYFALAQEAINENTEPASMLLQGGAEKTDTAPAKEEKPSLLEKALKEEPRK